MVVIHVKAEESEKQEFLYKCPSSWSIDEITDAIIEIATLQSKIQNLSLFLRETILSHSFKESCPDVALGLDRTLSEADTYASKDQVTYKRSLFPHILKDHIQAIEKEFKASHAKGLLHSDIPKLISEESMYESVQLWWAGKQLLRGKKLSEYIGANEKTKILIKLKLPCSGL